MDLAVSLYEHVHHCVSADSSLDILLGELTIAVRARRDLQNAKQRIDNQVGAKERIISGKLAAKKSRKRAAFVISPETRAAAGMVVPVLTPIAKALTKEIRAYEKQIAKLCEQLPAYGWVKQQRGFGVLNFGNIIGESGNLLNYSNPAKLWKRFGLAVMPDGRVQRRVKGEEAIYHGFSPSRRAVSHNLGDCLLKLNKGEYRQAYDERKAYELARLAGEKAVKIRSHKRAQRYMEKRALRDLWRAWRGQAYDSVSTSCLVPDSAVPNAG